MLTTVTSELKKVVIFSDRAQVSRHAKIDLLPGEQVFVFEDLPRDMDHKLLQVQCMKGATTDLVLQSVEHVTTSIKKDTNPQKAAIKDKLMVLRDAMTDLDDRIEMVEMRKNSLNRVNSRVMFVSEESSESRLDVGKWDPVLKFMWQGQKDATSQGRVLERERVKLQKEIYVLQENLNALGYENQTTMERVHVTVLATKPGTATLVLNYIIPKASWKPLYDVRVDSVKRCLVVSYHGVITQNTSEDWLDVDVELSTASPQVGGTAPELKPWRVSKASVYVAQKMSRSRGGARPQMHMMQQMMSAPAPGMMRNDFGGGGGGVDDEELSIAEDVLGVQGAAVNTKATSVFFAISGLQSVKCDGSESKVTIFQQEFPAHFRYSCVPKLTTHAYLKAKAINATECPLLAGSVNVFLDNNFVSTSKLDLVAPGSEFWVFLGVDDSVSVTHKCLNKVSSAQGGMLSSNKTRLTYTYQITVKNAKKTNEEVVVWDQIPISEDGKIKVELTDAYAKDTNDMKINDVNFVEWFLRLKPMEEKKIPFTFYVECPKGERVTALE